MTLAVLTYQRDAVLRRAVDSMVACAVPGPDAVWSLLEILIVDNNPDGSAKPVVADLAAAHHVTIRYTHEPQPGIVAARNRALTDAAGEVLVFLDDDEVALPGWPDGLLAVMERTGAAMVGGPVISEFVEEPPEWATEGRFFERDPRADGAEVTWMGAGNTAIDLQKLNPIGLRFDERYPHGEDAMYSRLAASKGFELRWSATAIAKEFVEPDRVTVEWCYRRQRISTDAWVRSDLDLDPSVRTQVLVAAKAGARFVQGLANLAVGAARRDLTTRVKGRALLAHAQGGIDGLRTFYSARSNAPS